MVGNKQNNAGGTGPDPLSGRVDTGADSGQRQQTGQDGASTSGHYTGSAGGGSRDGGFVSAPPESNVGPAGAPQSSRGSATQPIPGGTTGSESGEHGMGAAAAGGAPGTSAGRPDSGSQGGATDASVAGSAVEDLAQEGRDKPGGGDTR
ncbi:hypothetical protein [Massilia sp. GCM10023247]|uniref:hypothetical protein n=1 Tax=Massilia sp. GCM10023247 TaxID=3252643 RepID=UPI00361D1F93